MPTITQAKRQSASTTSADPSATSSRQSGTPWINGAPSGGSSTTLYLFTFLITILVLGLISSALLIRAYILRRRFHQRVEAAIRSGQPLPLDAAAALGMGPRRGPRGKKEKNHGLMPTMWESQMWRDKEKWHEDGADYDGDETGDEEFEKSNGWDELTPLSVLHFPEPVPATPPAPIVLPPPPSTRLMLRHAFSTRPINMPTRPALNSQLTSNTIPTSRAVYEIPPVDTEIVVGVMIAMPVEAGGEERWNLLEEGEERDLPEVCLGVMSAKIGQ